MRCTHGSTSGRVDEQQLFYAMTRGYTRREAVRMIVAGFFQQVFDRITIESVRDALGEAIGRRVSDIKELAAGVIALELLATLVAHRRLGDDGFRALVFGRRDARGRVGPNRRAAALGHFTETRHSDVAGRIAVACWEHLVAKLDSNLIYV